MFSIAFSKVYYSKIEPYEIRNISSNISGLILAIDEESIGKELTDKAYIRIDSELDEKELQFLNDKLNYLEAMVATNEKVFVNLKDTLSKKQGNYDTIKSLKIKSIVEKDNSFYDLVSTQNQLLNTQKEIQNLRVQMIDLKFRITQLKRNISDKYIVADGFVLYNIFVRAGQVVGLATPLAQVADISKAKLTIYLDEEDVLNAEKQVVYIDGEKTAYKVSRLLNIADSKNISKYMAQIIIQSPKLFSKLAKIELKNE